MAKRISWLRRLVLWQFTLLHRLSRWGSQRFTPLGGLLAVTCLAAGAFGIDTRRTLGYQAFSLLLILLALAWLVSLRLRLPVTLRRRLPQTATVGHPLRYQVTLGNRARRPLMGLLLGDQLAEPMPSAEDFVRAGHADRTGNRFDRIIGYPRWLRLLRLERGADIDRIALPDLPPGDDRTVSFTTTPLRRGYLHFRALLLARPDPLGLCLARQRQPAAEAILVLPRRYRVPPLNLPGGRCYQRGGRQTVSGIGDAREFCGLRDYRPGDPLRHIHWRTWAHTGEPVVKEYQDEYFMRLGLVLDSFLGERDPELFEEAVSVSASYAEAMGGGEGVIDLLFVGREAVHLSSGRGTIDQHRLLEVLACAEPCRERPFSTLPALLAGVQAELSACLCVFLDWDRPRQVLVGQLRGQGIPLQVIVIHPAGRDPPAPGPMADCPGRFLPLPAGRVQQRLDQVTESRR